ncbi:helix-turn-helix domain-containing protein [Salinicoccus sp. CNSTN-B1]
MESVGSRIRMRRKMIGLSQTALGRGIVSQSVISRLENDQFGISLDKLMRIMERLNLSLHDVFCNGEKTPAKMIQEALDTARRGQDFTKIKSILDKHDQKTWSQTPDLEGYKHWHEGLVEYSKGHLEVAQEKISRAIEKNRANEWMYEAVAEMYLAKGNIHHLMGKEGIDFYKEAEYYYQKSGRKSYRLIVKILYNLSTAYYRQGEYGKVLKYSDKSIEILNRYESTHLMCETLYNRSMAEFQLGNKTEALKIIDESKHIFRMGRKLEMVRRLNNYSEENILGN